MEVLKKLKTELPFDTATKHGLKLNMNSTMFTAALFTIAKIWKAT